MQIIAHESRDTFFSIKKKNILMILLLCNLNNGPQIVLTHSLHKKKYNLKLC